jgi:tRNA(fMet)-specific endonuclease VapC
MSRRLLDTDILSELIKGKNAAIAAKAATYLSQQGQFTTSAVTVAEIVYGFRRMGREDRVNQFEASLDATEVLPLDDAAARLAGRINADLESRGWTIGMGRRASRGGCKTCVAECAKRRRRGAPRAFAPSRSTSAALSH